MSDIEKARELLGKIQDMTVEMAGLLLPSNESNEEREESPEGIKVGDRVLIIKGTHNNKKGLITGNCGSKFLWIKLDDGEKIRKMPHLLLRCDS